MQTNQGKKRTDFSLKLISEMKEETTLQNLWTLKDNKTVL